jgi:hypothetical protein
MRLVFSAEKGYPRGGALGGVGVGTRGGSGADAPGDMNTDSSPTMACRRQQTALVWLISTHKSVFCQVLYGSLLGRVTPG